MFPWEDPPRTHPHVVIRTLATRLQHLGRVILQRLDTANQPLHIHTEYSILRDRTGSISIKEGTNKGTGLPES